MTINGGSVTHDSASVPTVLRAPRERSGGSAGGAGGGGLSLEEVNFTVTGVAVAFNQANSGNGGSAGVGGCFTVDLAGGALAGGSLSLSIITGLEI